MSQTIKNVWHKLGTVGQLLVGIFLFIVLAKHFSR